MAISAARRISREWIPVDCTYQDTEAGQVDGGSDSSNNKITGDLKDDIRDEKDEEDDRILFRSEIEISLETSCPSITDVGSIEIRECV